MKNIKKHHSPKGNINEKHFRGMIESTPGIPWMVDFATLQFTYVGPQAEKILGYPVERWYETGFWSQHIHPDDKQAALDYYMKASQKNRGYNFEYRMIHRDGHSVWILDYINIIIENDTPVRLQGFMFDINGDKQAEQTLQEHTALLDAMYHASPDMIFIHDDDGRILSVNNNAAQRYNYTMEEMRALSIADVSANPGCLPPVKKCMQQVLNGEELDFEWLARDSNNKPFPVEVRLRKLEGSGAPGTPAIIATIRDITKRISTETELKTHREHLEELVEQRTTELTIINEELESFSYSVSHDLRAPLRHIDGFSQALQEDYVKQLDKNGQQQLQRIRNSAQRMGQLIDDLLMLSRASRGNVEREPLNLSSMVQDIFNKLHHYDANRKVSINIQDNVLATADHRLVHVLLENLSGNAWKYTSRTEHANIHFDATINEKGETVFCLRDNGAGFDMKHAERLFTAFKRLHSDRDFEGTGIGLATVQRIINRHSGRVWATAQTGKGAAFYFTLNS